MQTIDDASQEAVSPAAKSALDRLYGILEAIEVDAEEIDHRRYVGVSI
jgi:hypothetical protein